MTKLNRHQTYAIEMIKEAFLDGFLGYENTLQDYPKDSEEYKMAYEVLHMGHEKLVEMIYRLVQVYAKNNAIERHINFAGKDFIKERISKRLEKYGY